MASSRKRVVTINEGPEAAWRFEHGIKRLLGVSRQELEKREAEYQETRKSKPRPGPKPKK